MNPSDHPRTTQSEPSFVPDPQRIESTMIGLDAFLDGGIRDYANFAGGDDPCLTHQFLVHANRRKDVLRDFLLKEFRRFHYVNHAHLKDEMS